ncbi:MAG: 3-deoxy-manno-octulosonate cytidylyltransferase [Desulfamplus sp.]|nr:3-deoxy-manno-octulosonate cytidylyltransferase [Desulfamplus sp.]
MNNKITAIIPSRFGSKRFEGKPLAFVSGKPMIQRVYEQAIKAKNIAKVVVATDDEKIFKAVESFGGEAILTDSSLRSGTDRVAQAANILKLQLNDIVVNIQGDQPIFNPICIDQMVEPFRVNSELLMSTLACKILNPKEITDPKDVKVVIDKNGYALYFSRSQIPFPRDAKDHIGYNEVEYYKHLGFYAYKKSFLDTVAALEEGYLERVEKLEQLRVIEHGYKICVVTTEHDSPEVDTPEDIERIEKLDLTILLNGV